MRRHAFFALVLAGAIVLGTTVPCLARPARGAGLILADYDDLSNPSRQRYGDTSQDNSTWLDSLTVGETWGNVVWIIVPVAAIGSLVFFVNRRWRVFRNGLLDKQSDAVTALLRPGTVAEHLAPARWTQTIRATLERAGESFKGAAAGSTQADAAAAIQAAMPMVDQLADGLRTLAEKAMNLGEPQSLLVRTQGAPVYAVVFPGRHEYARLLRRHPPFADGWLAHAGRIRRAVGAAGMPAAVMCLLYFLNPDARGGTLLVAYDAEGGRIVPADLADPADQTAGVVRRPERFEFQLA